MTPEQMNSLLNTIFDGLLKIGGLAIAIFSIWFQGRQETKRATMQRSWATDDRNMIRKWKQNDDLTNQRREQFLQNRKSIDEYIEAIVEICSSVTAIVVQNGYQENYNQNIKTKLYRSFEMTSETAHRSRVIGDPETTKRLIELSNTLAVKLRPAILTPSTDLNILDLLTLTITETASLSARLDELALKLMDTQDYE